RVGKSAVARSPDGGVVAGGVEERPQIGAAAGERGDQREAGRPGDTGAARARHVGTTATQARDSSGPHVRPSDGQAIVHPRAKPAADCKDRVNDGRVWRRPAFSTPNPARIRTASERREVDAEALVHRERGALL